MEDPQTQGQAKIESPEPLQEQALTDPTQPQEMAMKESWGPFKTGELFPYKGYWLKFLAFSEQGFVVIPVSKTKKNK